MKLAVLQKKESIHTNRFICIESKAFEKSTKFTCSGLLNSAHCSMTVLRVKIQPLPTQNPACSSLSLVSICLSILFKITLHKTLLGIESSIIPLQLSQFFKSPFFGSFIITPLDQSIGIFSSIH